MLFLKGSVRGDRHNFTVIIAHLEYEDSIASFVQCRTARPGRKINVCGIPAGVCRKRAAGLAEGTLAI